MSKFKVGDRVRIWHDTYLHYPDKIECIEKGKVGIVLHALINCCQVEFDGGVSVLCISDSDLETYSPKTAFIAELKGLLAKYDASIYPNGCVVDGIGFKVGNEDIYYNMNYGFGDFITADNIHDYDKEEV